MKLQSGKYQIFKGLFLLLLISMVVFSCRKDEIIDTDPSIKLSFSTDTVIFDTVFTTLGSATHGLKIYNTNNNTVKISSLRLAGGSNSFYTINVDGVAATSLKDIEISGNDSLYIFVRVRIDPTNQNNPFIVTDSILFETNGNLQDVDLVAYGQNAHFYANTVYQVNGVWTNDLPHVVYGYVIIDSLYSLTITPGTQVYMHRNSILAVANDASLKIQGTLTDPVIFQGDRLEEDYKELPGQWGAIWLSAGSYDNEIDYAIIKNGIIGIRVDTLGNSPNPTLRLTNTQIMNMTGYGLLAQGSYVDAANCVFANCGESAVVLSIGGTYDLRHCTIGNFWNHTFRQTSSLVLTNYYLLYNDMGFITDTIARDLHKAYFGNCIVYGNNDNELFQSRTVQAEFNYTFDHCLLKTEILTDPNYIEPLFNQDPLFTDYQNNDYSLDSIISPAVNYGAMDVINSSILDITFDIEGISRTADGEPDLGAFEYQER